MSGAPYIRLKWGGGGGGGGGEGEGWGGTTFKAAIYCVRGIL